MLVLEEDLAKASKVSRSIISLDIRRMKGDTENRPPERRRPVQRRVIAGQIFDN